MLSEGELVRRADLVARVNLGCFIERGFGVVSPNDAYEHNWHIDCIAEYLGAMERGEMRRLVVNMPPRMLKSICISIAWPAWLLGHNPREQIVACSYTAALGAQQSVKTREIMRSEWYSRIFPGVHLKKELETQLVTEQGGMRYTAGVGGSLLGMGGNYLIADDPLDPEQAASEIERKRANDWIADTFLTRFNDRRTGRAVVVMQRLHSDDVTGRLLEIGGWEHLCLAGQFSKRTVISIGSGKRGKEWVMEPGETLDKSRMSPEVLEQIKREYNDPFRYAAQILQNPTPEEGAFFQKSWLKFYDELPEGMRFYGASDFAVTSGGGDWTVHLIMGVCPNDDWYLVDMWRSQEHSEVWANAEVDMMEEYKPLEWLEEKGVIEKAVDPLMQKLMQERKVHVHRNKIASTKDKVTRAQPLRGRMAAGRVFFPKKYPWMSDVMKEVMEFPNSKHDDIVDALSLFGLNTPNLRKGVIKAKKEEKPTYFKDVMAAHFKKCKAQREELRA